MIVVGLAGALLASRGGDTESGDVATTGIPPTTVAPAPIDIGAADPIQATNDQASRVTVTFAGNARALAQGAAHIFEIEVQLEGSNELIQGPQ